LALALAQHADLDRVDRGRHLAALEWCGIPLSLGEALLFGALISPTDFPSQFWASCASAKVPNDLAVQISGESLFKRRHRVVLFVVISAATAGTHPSATGVIGLIFARGRRGALFGLALGYVAYRVLRSIDDYSVEVLNHVWRGGPVATGRGAAARLGADRGSGFGPVSRQPGATAGAMSDETRKYVDMFWKLVDELLTRCCSCSGAPKRRDCS